MNLNSKINFKKPYSVFILIALLVLTAFTINNFLAVARLQSQTEIIIASLPGDLKIPNNTLSKDLSSQADSLTIQAQEDLLLPPEELISAEVQEPEPAPTSSEETVTHSNVFSETFYSQYYINKDETNLYFDGQVSALTFTPLYELVLQESCQSENCGFSVSRPEVFLEKNGWNFLGRSLSWPNEIKEKEIKAVFADQLEKKYLVSFIIAEGKQEIVFSYFSDNRGRLIYLDTAAKMTTRIGYGNGYVSAGGSDEQFIIFYSGYEPLALLYNQGAWQELTYFFDLRVTGGGFASKVLKLGSGSEATWYICSTDKSQHFLKLWQNASPEIQGSINLTAVGGYNSSACFVEKNKLYLVQGGKKYLFKDQGFDNSHDYQYSSNNINNYQGKKVQQVYFFKKTINADLGSFSFFASFDNQNWQEILGDGFTFDNNKDSDQLFLRLQFKAGDSDFYSPWFGGLENVFYTATN